MALLRLENISKTFGTEVKALQDISFAVEQGELIALLGESGSGKTTLLRIIAGFEVANAGAVHLSDTLLCDQSTFVQPERRGIGMVFQEHALFPHLSVKKNITFGLKDKSLHDARTREMLNLVDLANHEQRYPHELSGGQQQRIAIARALAPAPNLLLLDEPFSNLDESLKEKVRMEIRDILKKSNTTALFVTHDTKDALSVADRILVLKNGRIQQFGTPDELFNRPANAAVAHLFGERCTTSTTIKNGRLQLPFGELAMATNEGTVTVGIPSAAVILHEQGVFTGTIRSSTFQGHHFVLAIESEGLELQAKHATAMEAGTAVKFNLNPEILNIWS